MTSREIILQPGSNYHIVPPLSFHDRRLLRESYDPGLGISVGLLDEPTNYNYASTKVADPSGLDDINCDALRQAYDPPKEKIDPEQIYDPPTVIIPTAVIEHLTPEGKKGFFIRLNLLFGLYCFGVEPIIEVV